MTLDIRAIRHALADQLQPVVNSGEYGCNWFAYPPATVPDRAALVLPRSFEDGHYISYHGTFARHLCAVGFSLELRVVGNDQDAAETLDGMLSSFGPSIIEFFAGEPGKNLDGVVEDVYVAGSTVPARYAANEADARTWLASSFNLQVLARR